jgi:hypothetical protein
MALTVKNIAGENVELPDFEGMRQVVGNTKANSDKVQAYLNEQKVKNSDVAKAIAGKFQKDSIMKVSASDILTSDDTKPYFNNIIDDSVREGAFVESKWSELAPNTTGATSARETYLKMTVDDPTDPNTNDSDNFEMRRIAEGGQIPVSYLSLGEESIKIGKFGRGIGLTDESKRAKIDQFQLWARRLGVKLGFSYEKAAIHTLLNGYFGNEEDAAPTIGVKTANTVTPLDLFYAFQSQQQTYGLTANRMILNLNDAMKIMEFADGDGRFIFTNAMLQGDFPDLFAQMYISSFVPEGRIIFANTQYSLERKVLKPFGTEFDRAPGTQSEATYATEESEFVIFDKNARVILTLDETRG